MKQKKHRIIKRAIAVLLIFTVAFNFFKVLPTDTKAENKGEYPLKLGDDNNESTMYQWHLVKSDGSKDSKKMYDFLSDSAKAEVEAGNQSMNPSQRAFRVLLGYKNYEPTHTGPEYIGDYYYYEANWTRVCWDKEGGASYGVSGISVSDNPQVRIGEDSFITRGSLRSFYCTYEGKGIGSQYENAFKYKFYYPYEENGQELKRESLLYDAKTVDTSKCRLLTYCEGGIHKRGKFIVTQGKTTNIFGSTDYAWNDIKNDMKNNCEDMRDSDNYYYDFAVSASGKGKLGGKQTFNLTAKDTLTVGDGQLIHSYSGDRNHDYGGVYANALYAANTSSSNNDAQLNWLIYVGEPIGDLKGSSLDEVTKTYEINEVAWIRREQTVKVDEDGILFINSPVFLNGTIENHGIIMIQKGGCILSIDPGSAPSTIENIGGDLIVDQGGLVNVSAVKTHNGGQIINHSKYFLTRSMFSGDCVLDGVNNDNIGRMLQDCRCIAYTKGGPKSTGDGDKPYTFTLDLSKELPTVSVCKAATRTADEMRRLGVVASYENIKDPQEQAIKGTEIIQDFTHILVNKFDEIHNKYKLSECGFDLRYKGTKVVSGTGVKKEAKDATLIDEAYPTVETDGKVKDGITWEKIKAAMDSM